MNEFVKELRTFLRSRQPVNLLLVVINVVVFLIFSVIGSTEDMYFMVQHGAAYTPFIIDGDYYRLFTCMFLHFGVQHLFYNMILLLYIGDSLEKNIGKVKYLMIYLLGGLAGNLTSVGFDLLTKDFAVSAGASGAIFAVLGALIWIVLRNRGSLDGYSMKRLLLMAGLSVVNGLTSTGIDNCAHIGGLLTGFVLAVLLYRKNKNAYHTAGIV